jgi:hypothetical protein
VMGSKRADKPVTRDGNGDLSQTFGIYKDELGEEESGRAALLTRRVEENWVRWIGGPMTRGIARERHDRNHGGCQHSRVRRGCESRGSGKESAWKRLQRRTG